MKRILVFFLTAVFLCACVPTPEVTEYRREENTADFEQAVSDIPESFERTETLPDGIRLEVHAKVVKPDAPLSVGTVTRTPFDTATAERVCRALFGEAPIYEYFESKRELAEYILTCREQMEAAKDALSEAELSDLASTLNDMEAALPNLPDEGKPASYGKLFGYDNGFMMVDTGKPRMATFQARADSRNILSFTDLGFRKHLIEEIEPLKVSEEDAVRQAEEILKKLGLEDRFVAVKTGVHPVNHTMVDQMLDSKGYRFPQRHERRYVVFMRKIGDAKQVYSEQIQYGSTDGGYEEAVFWEVMEFQFDNDGLVGFHWQEPGEVTVTQNNVSVIDLDTAYRAMTDWLKASQNKYTYEDYGVSPGQITASVDRIELGMSCILGRDRTIEVVPVWEFFGEIEYRDASQNVRYISLLQHCLTDETRGCNSICTISALTGKRIDRGLGY